MAIPFKSSITLGQLFAQNNNFSIVSGGNKTLEINDVSAKIQTPKEINLISEKTSINSTSFSSFSSGLSSITANNQISIIGKNAASLTSDKLVNIGDSGLDMPTVRVRGSVFTWNSYPLAGYVKGPKGVISSLVSEDSKYMSLNTTRHEWTIYPAAFGLSDFNKVQRLEFAFSVRVHWRNSFLSQEQMNSSSVIEGKCFINRIDIESATPIIWSQGTQIIRMFPNKMPSVPFNMGNTCLATTFIETQNMNGIRIKASFFTPQTDIYGKPDIFEEGTNKCCIIYGPVAWVQ